MQIAANREVCMDTNAGLERLFEEHHTLVLQAAYQITGNASEAEDVLQTVFVRLLKHDESHWGQVTKGYLKRAAINAALDILRGRKKSRAVAIEVVEHSLSTQSAGPHRLYSASELRKWFREAISRLNPTAAEIFVLKYLQDIGNNEIAELLGTSPGTVAVTLHRTRAHLQNEIESAYGEES